MSSIEKSCNVLPSRKGGPRSELLIFLCGICVLLFNFVLIGCSASEESANDFDETPKLRDYSPPEFPPSVFLSNRVEEVELRLLISEEGKVEKVLILRSTGNRECESAAMEAAMKWRYSPARKKGKPVVVWVEQKVTFKVKPMLLVSFYELEVSSQELADSLWQLLNDGENFSTLARKYSIAKSVAEGGFRENVISDVLDPNVAAALAKLRDGELSHPVRTKKGDFVILKREK